MMQEIAKIWQRGTIKKNLIVDWTKPNIKMKIYVRKLPLPLFSNTAITTGKNALIVCHDYRCDGIPPSYRRK